MKEHRELLKVALQFSLPIHRKILKIYFDEGMHKGPYVAIRKLYNNGYEIKKHHAL